MGTVIAIKLKGIYGFITGSPCLACTRRVHLSLHFGGASVFKGPFELWVLESVPTESWEVFGFSNCTSSRRSPFLNLGWIIFPEWCNRSRGSLIIPPGPVDIAF